MPELSVVVDGLDVLRPRLATEMNPPLVVAEGPRRRIVAALLPGFEPPPPPHPLGQRVADHVERGSDAVEVVVGDHGGSLPEVTREQTQVLDPAGRVPGDHEHLPVDHTHRGAAQGRGPGCLPRALPTRRRAPLRNRPPQSARTDPGEEP